jgi:hypothetical protein
MTETVVTTSNNTVVVDNTVNQTVVEVNATTTIVTGMMGPPGSTSISGMADTDVSNLTAGSLLVYNTQTAKWTSTTLLNQQYVDCGQF